MTATQAARELGETPQRCTFHLGQLAKHGLVEEAGGGRGRERPWRATASSTSWPNVASGPEAAVAAQMLEAVVVEQHFESVMAYIDGKDEDPRGVAGGGAAQRRGAVPDGRGARGARPSGLGPARALRRPSRGPGAAARRRAARHLPQSGVPEAAAGAGRGAGRRTDGPRRAGRGLTARGRPSRGRAMRAPDLRVARDSTPGAPAGAPRLPPLLGGADGLADRRPDLADRAAAGRRALARRERRGDGVPDRRGARPQPAVLAARRRPGGPARAPAPDDDRRGPGTRPVAGARPARRGARRALHARAVRDRLPHRRAGRAVHGLVQRALRGAGAAGRLRRRHVAAQREPRALGRRGPEHRRPAGAGADGAGRDRRGRRVVPGLGGSSCTGSTPWSRPARRRGAGWCSAARGSSPRRPSCARRCSPRPPSTSSTTGSSRCSSSTRRARWASRRGPWAWCSARGRWAG